MHAIDVYVYHTYEVSSYVSERIAIAISGKNRLILATNKLIESLFTLFTPFGSIIKRTEPRFTFTIGLDNRVPPK